jgi:hypothetical protein
MVQFDFYGKDFSRNDGLNRKPVISNPFGILRVNSERDLSELNDNSSSGA